MTARPPQRQRQPGGGARCQGGDWQLVAKSLTGDGAPAGSECTALLPGPRQPAEGEVTRLSTGRLALPRRPTGTAGVVTNGREGRRGTADGSYFGLPQVALIVPLPSATLVTWEENRTVSGFISQEADAQPNDLPAGTRDPSRRATRPTLTSQAQSDGNFHRPQISTKPQGDSK